MANRDRVRVRWARKEKDCLVSKVSAVIRCEWRTPTSVHENGTNHSLVLPPSSECRPPLRSRFLTLLIESYAVEPQKLPNSSHYITRPRVITSKRAWIRCLLSLLVRRHPIGRNLGRLDLNRRPCRISMFWRLRRKDTPKAVMEQNYHPYADIRW